MVSHHDVHNSTTLFFIVPEDKSERDNPLQLYLDNIMELKKRNNQDCVLPSISFVISDNTKVAMQISFHFELYDGARNILEAFHL